MFKKIINLSVRLVQRYLPEPFIFAIILTFVAFVAAIPLCRQTPIEVMENWGDGIWSLLAFSMQMALVLVCGSVLAEAPSVKKGISKLASVPKNPFSAIAMVTLVSCLACWINWGFGLIVGVIFAKEIAKKVRRVDYRLLIASAYSGFVVWHAGMSGSIPLTMATPGEALSTATKGIVTSPIPISSTIFNLYNLCIVAVVIMVLCVVNTLMHPKDKDVVFIDATLLEQDSKTEEKDKDTFRADTPAAKMENSQWISLIISLVGMLFLFTSLFIRKKSLDLNFVILLFLFLGLIVHKRPGQYVKYFTRATSGAAGILLQFPFYAGIMGIITGTGVSGISLGMVISNFFVDVSNNVTFPLFTFLSAGVINVFVPSGGRAVGGSSPDNVRRRSEARRRAVSYRNGNSLGRRLDKPHSAFLGFACTCNSKA